jgi:hypothetical protein
MDDEIQAEPPRGLREEAITERRPLPKIANVRVEPLMSADKDTTRHDVAAVIVTVMLVCCLSGCLLGVIWSDYVFQPRSSYLGELRSTPRAIHGAGIGLWIGTLLLIWRYRRSLRQDHPVVVLFGAVSTGGFLCVVLACIADPPWNHGFPTLGQLVFGWDVDLQLTRSAAGGALVGLLAGTVLLLFLKIDSYFEAQSPPQRPPEIVTVSSEVDSKPPEQSQAIQEPPTST